MVAATVDLPAFVDTFAPGLLLMPAINFLSASPDETLGHSQGGAWLVVFVLPASETFAADGALRPGWQHACSETVGDGLSNGDQDESGKPERNILDRKRERGSERA